MNDVLIATENTKFADKLLYNVGKQPEGSIVVIIGDPGTGKTFYAKHKAYTNGWIYQCVKATELPKSFLQGVHSRLSFLIHGKDSHPRGNTPELQEACNKMFQHPKVANKVFVFDEINLLIQFRKWGILEIIRQFRDIAGATIMMIGENDSKGLITAYNEHYFSRCKFVEFSILSIADLIRIIKGRSELEFDNATAEYLISNETKDEKGKSKNECHGSVRIATDRLEILEQEARRQGKARIIFEEVKGVTYAAI